MRLRSNASYSLDQNKNYSLKCNKSSKYCWAVLPPEIRLMILDELTKQDGRPQLARWASVSQEWKAVFEPHIFKSLTVQFPGSDIESLDQFVDGYRRNFVKRISLHVKTAEYDVKEEYDKVETYKTKRENNKTFTQALQHLFSVLSTWSCRTFAKGIALELSASSPSDVDHPYQHRHNQSQHDSSRAYSLNSRRRLIGNLLDLSSAPLELPRVPIVTRFSVNQHYYRSLSGASLAKILSSMCHLRIINYEPWRAVGPEGHVQRDEASIKLFECVKESATVRSVRLWEAQSPLHGNPRFVRPVNRKLVSAAVRASYRLRSLAICHAIDAKEFFQYPAAGRTLGKPSKCLGFWPTLKQLALTTYIGELHSSPARVDSLLLKASQVASHMPSLEIMEIWAPGIREGFLFRYDIHNNEAKIDVRATWQFEFSDEVVKSWQRIGCRYAKLEFSHEARFIEPGTMDPNSPYEFCSKLRLRTILREWMRSSKSNECYQI